MCHLVYVAQVEITKESEVCVSFIFTFLLLSLSPLHPTLYPSSTPHRPSHAHTLLSRLSLPRLAMVHDVIQIKIVHYNPVK
jgi:hypothetical protein